MLNANNDSNANNKPVQIPTKKSNIPEILTTLGAISLYFSLAGVSIVVAFIMGLELYLEYFFIMFSLTFGVSCILSIVSLSSKRRNAKRPPIVAKFNKIMCISSIAISNLWPLIVVAFFVLTNVDAFFG